MNNNITLFQFIIVEIIKACIMICFFMSILVINLKQDEIIRELQNRVKNIQMQLNNIIISFESFFSKKDKEVEKWQTN